LGSAAASGKLVVLIPIGAVEPHGPHLGLGSDITISEGAAERAAERLTSCGLTALVAPSIPYGVTECAAGFPGAISVPASALHSYLQAVVAGFLGARAAHVCLINNHLEPEQDLAVRAVGAAFTAREVSVASPLTRRWARTLSPEFKSGACHAGRYETSLVMAQDESMVDAELAASLPEVPISLSEQLASGVSDFRAMGLERAYAGAPAQATLAEGRELLDLLAEMVVTEVLEGLGLKGV
jgi:creatinine amidohydrolase